MTLKLNRDQLLPIMYWGDFTEAPKPDQGLAMLVGLFMTALTGRVPNPEPQKCVRPDIPTDRRELAARLLKNGTVVERYFGHANCRICGEQLGSADLGGFGMVWPEGCEHYVLRHGVWVPGLDRLIERSGN